MGRLNPVFVEVTRGDMVESRHRGAAAVVDADGSVVHAWGDVERPVYSRSAIKPLQALPLVETGAAERFAVSDAEIALACGSHGGAPEHVRPVAAWLERIGLAPGDLECGTHPPMDPAAAGALVRAGEDPSPLHNNCSGKHAGFLTTAVHLGEATAGYVRPDHPVQKRIERVLADLGGVALEGAARGTDGCGIPVIAMPLTAIARAMARLADPRGLAPARAAAVRRLVAAMTGHPDLVAGRERFDTVAIEAGRGAFVVKIGAEGVYVAAVASLGLGVALKIDDGARRAAETAMAVLLRHLGALDAKAQAALKPYLDRPVPDRAGVRVGSVGVAKGWLA